MKTISRKLRNITLLSFLFFVMVSCVTINIYFPAAAVEKVADEIVEEVWGVGGAEPNGREEETIEERSQEEPGDREGEQERGEQADPARDQQLLA